MNNIFQSFNSGSNGNCSVLKIEEDIILIDAGISRKRIIEGLRNLEISPNKLKYILITHEHNDHVAGLPVLSSKINFQIITTKGTIEGIRKLAKQDKRYEEIADNAIIIETYVPKNIGNFKIIAYPNIHDTLEPISFYIEHRLTNISIVYLTDTLVPDEQLKEKMKEADILFIESNYDCKMLENSGRPYTLIERIKKTHLSNKQAMKILIEVISEKTKLLALGHLSEDCNDPELVRKYLKGLKYYLAKKAKIKEDYLKKTNFKSMVATRFEPSEIFYIKKEK